MARKAKKKIRRKSSKSQAGGAFKFFFKAAWKCLPLVLAVVFAGGLFFGVRTALYADPRLSIKEVTVYPPFALSRGRRQDLETGVLGRNILQVDLKKLAANLQTNPEVQSAQVSRNFPSSLSVHIKTRRPMALIQFSPRGDFGLVSEDGMILDVMKEPSPSFVSIKAYSMGITAPSAGRRIKSSALDETAKFLNTYARHPVSKRESLSGISVDQHGNVSITLGEGPDIRLGRRPSERIATLDKMMYLLEGDGRAQIEYVDLQYDNVIVKRKK